MFQALKYALLGLHFLIHNLEGLFGFPKSGRRTWRRKSIKIYILWHRHTAFLSAFFTKVLFSNEAKHLKESSKSHKNVNQIQIDSSSVFLQFGQTLQAMYVVIHY